MTQPQQQLLRPYDGPTALTDMIAMSNLLATARSGVPEQVQGDPGCALGLIVRARSLNIPLGVALDNLVFGRRGACAMRARLMLALLNVRGGHRIRVVSRDEREVVAQLIFGDGREPVTERWTLATAQASGLIAKSPAWQHHADTMLYWRTISKLIGKHCPEAILGIGLAEAGDHEYDDDFSIGEITETTGNPGEVNPGEVNPAEVNPSAVEILEVLGDLTNDNNVTINDNITRSDLREAWSRSKKEGLLGAPVSVTGMTLDQAITALVSQLDERAESLPAGEGILPCGCAADQVIATGQHSPSCATNG